jgi:cytochrome c oxidase subunit II
MNKLAAVNWMARAALLGIAFLGTVTVGRTASEPGGNAKVIKVTAQRFRYTPSEIQIKKGQSAVLEFTSVDFVHGFKIPALGIRADLPPGKITRVTLKPEKVGAYDFLCDNFCGSGHEEMSGRIVVTD